MSTASSKAFLGQGWKFPLSVNARGGISMLSGDDDIEAAIKVILLTSKGERVMRPTFGSSLNDYVFAPNQATTHGLIAYEVRESLEMWEPRIEILDVNVTAHTEQPDCVLIDINYYVKAINDERNLVFPFYIIPGEE